MLLNDCHLLLVVFTRCRYLKHNYSESHASIIAALSTLNCHSVSYTDKTIRHDIKTEDEEENKQGL